MEARRRRLAEQALCRLTRIHVKSNRGKGGAVGAYGSAVNVWLPNGMMQPISNSCRKRPIMRPSPA